jgi:hypothetical protein
MRTLGSKANFDSIVRRISALTSSDRRLWGRMSSPEMVCHLCDSFRVALGEKSASSASSFALRTIVKWVALRLPLKWPQSSATPPEVEQGRGGTPPGEFDKDRAELLSAMSRFCSKDAELKIPHPFFGCISRQEWLRWGYLHADHHLRQFGR